MNESEQMSTTKMEKMEVGKFYQGGDTTYRLDAIHENGQIDATPLVGPHMPKASIDRKRVRFTTLHTFVRWLNREADDGAITRGFAR